MALEAQAHTHDLSIRMPVEPFTEVGIIAERYNQVMDSLENALSHTEAVVSLAKDAIITFVNDTLEIININPSGMMMFGFAADHPIAGTKLPDLFSQTDFLQIKQPLYRGKTVETIGRRQCGTFFPLQATITDAGKGNNNFYIGTFRDITELKEQERSLRESEIRYRQLFENIGIATIMVDSDTKLIMVNKEAAELAGYDREHMEGQMHFAELLPPLEKISFEEYQELSRCQPGEVPITMESKIFNKSGKIIPVYMTISRIAGTDKTVTSIIDLSELHQAKDSLSKQKAFFYQLFEGSSQAIAALDTSLNVLDVNQGFKRIFDYSQQEVHSRSLLDFIIPETHIEEANTIQAAIQSGHMVQKESVRKNKDGRIDRKSVV
jgi:Amt family ammonium transporter